MPSSLLVPVELSDDERAQLESWTRRRTSAEALALRSRIVLLAAAGRNNTEIAGAHAIAAGVLQRECAREVLHAALARGATCSRERRAACSRRTRAGCHRTRAASWLASGTVGRRVRRAPAYRAPWVCHVHPDALLHRAPIGGECLHAERVRAVGHQRGVDLAAPRVIHLGVVERNVDPVSVRATVPVDIAHSHFDRHVRHRNGPGHPSASSIQCQLVEAAASTAPYTHRLGTTGLRPRHRSRRHGPEVPHSSRSCSLGARMRRRRRS
jgi:hypothetical protein